MTPSFPIISVRFLILSFFCAWPAAPLLAVPRSQAPSPPPVGADFFLPFQKVFDARDVGQDSWKPEEENAQIRFWSYEGIGTIEALKTEKPWGALYKRVTVDLDRYPFLEINVLSTTKPWYLLLGGPEFRNGYLRLIETRQIGHFTFDIPKISKLSGEQTFDVKVGLSNPDAKPLANERLSLDKLVFIVPNPFLREESGRKPARGVASKAVIAKAPSQFVFNPSGRDIDLWKEQAKEGPLEVSYSVKGGVAMVKGRIEDRNWGAAHRQVAVDLRKFPVLEVNVTGCSKSWYLVLTQPGLPQGYVRLIETDQPGLHSFDVPALTGLGGIQNFEIQFGVSDPKGTTVKGEWASFNLMRFRGK